MQCFQLRKYVHAHYVNATNMSTTRAKFVGNKCSLTQAPSLTFVLAGVPLDLLAKKLSNVKIAIKCWLGPLVELSAIVS